MNGTDTGTGTVLMAIHRSGISWCYAKDSESSTRGGGYYLSRPEPISRQAAYVPQAVRFIGVRARHGRGAPASAHSYSVVRVSIERGRPYGGEEWVRQTVKDLGLEHTVRLEGRPRKASQSATDSTK
jgi:hypothetical protein